MWSFCLIGALGLVVDAGTLFGLIERFGVTPLPARVVSLLIAVTVTWALNRRWIFRCNDPERLAEWSRFLALSLAGAALNYAVYAGVLVGLPGTPPLLALAMGSGLALLASHAGAQAFRASRLLKNSAAVVTSPPWGEVGPKGRVRGIMSFNRLRPIPPSPCPSPRRGEGTLKRSLETFFNSLLEQPASYRTQISCSSLLKSINFSAIR